MIKRSIIWKMPIDEFNALVARCFTFKEILDYFGFNTSNSATIKRRIKADNVDCSHIPQGFAANRGRHFWNKPPIPFDKLFIENSPHSRGTVKRYIIKHKLILYKCATCNLEPEWNGKPLVLILDHINGKRNNCRLDNLRFVCPNCDHQSSTFGSRNIAQPHICIICGIKIQCKSTYCMKCANNRDRTKTRKVDRPSKEQLYKMVWSIPTTTIARQYGITDKAVSRWCKSYGISKPGPGYWMKHSAAEVLS